MIWIPFLSKIRGLPPGIGAALRVDPRTRHVIACHDDGAEYDLEPTPRWDDLRTPLEVARPSTSPPGYESFRGNAYAYLFDGNSTEHVYLAVQMPHNWKFGTTIKPHVHIGWPAAPVNGQTVRFVLDYTVQTPNAGIFAAQTTILADYTIDTTRACDAQYGHAMLVLPDISMAGHSASAMLLCRLYRLGATDTYAGDVACFEFDLHYEVDSFGTIAENSGK